MLAFGAKANKHMTFTNEAYLCGFLDLKKDTTLFAYPPARKAQEKSIKKIAWMIKNINGRE